MILLRHNENRSSNKYNIECSIKVQGTNVYLTRCNLNNFTDEEKNASYVIFKILFRVGAIPDAFYYNHIFVSRIYPDDTILLAAFFFA